MKHYMPYAVGAKVSFDHYENNEFKCELTGRVVCLYEVETAKGYSNMLAAKVKCDQNGIIYDRAWNAFREVKDS